MKALLLVGIFICTHFFSYGQFNDSTKSVKDYNQHTMFKGLLIDLGTAYLSETTYNGMPDFFNVRTGRPSTVNIYLFKNIRIVNHTFTFSPGLGFGLDNYFFEKDVLIAPSGDSLFTLGQDLKKSKLSANYIDIPLEFRFASSSNYKKAFKVAIGGKFGVLFSGKSKIKYKQDGDIVKQKFSDISLNKIRYGLTGRIGLGHLNLFGYYSLSSLFKDKYAPEMNPIIFGISLTSF